MRKKQHHDDALTAKQLLEKLKQMEKEEHDLNHPIIIRAARHYNLKPDIEITKDWEYNSKNAEIEFDGNLKYNIAVNDYWLK